MNLAIHTHILCASYPPRSSSRLCYPVHLHSRSGKRILYIAPRLQVHSTTFSSWFHNDRLTLRRCSFTDFVYCTNKMSRKIPKSRNLTSALFRENLNLRPGNPSTTKPQSQLEVINHHGYLHGTNVVLLTVDACPGLSGITFMAWD